VVFIYTVSGVVRGERGIYIYRVRGGERIAWYLYIPCQVYINTTLSSHHSHFILHIQPLKMDLTEGPETSAKHNLTPGNTQKNIYNVQNTAKV
jgi:hypothetical protein